MGARLTGEELPPASHTGDVGQFPRPVPTVKLYFFLKQVFEAFVLMYTRP